MVDATVVSAEEYTAPGGNSDSLQSAAMVSDTAKTNDTLAQVGTDSADVKKIAVADTSVINQDTYIKISGLRSFSFQSRRKVSGTTPYAFVPYRMRQDLLKMRVDGRLRKSVDVAGDVLQSSVPGEEELMSFMVKGAKGEVFWGRYDRALEGGEFASVEKSLNGIRAKGAYRRLNAEGIYATPEGRFGLERLRGNGTQGPYQLGASPVVYGSEKIKIVRGVNAVTLQKGIDYSIDYTGGSVLLIKNIVDPDEYLEIQYESQAGSGYKQLLYGIQAETGFGATYGVTVTHINLADQVKGLDAGDSLPEKPVSRALYNVTQKFSINRAFALQTETAMSLGDSNRLESGVRQKGYAYELQGSGIVSTIEYRVRYRRTEPA
ncbi:MAG: hypothetical protein QME74_01300, partial [Candidatus Edwardsbacteria bacterium]|nr:hypothetical protein [Candidatus Edwardsbacteria bacterium]